MDDRQRLNFLFSSIVFNVSYDQFLFFSFELKSSPQIPTLPSSFFMLQLSCLSLLAQASFACIIMKSQATPAKTEAAKQQLPKFFDRQEQHIYNTITARNKYKLSSFLEKDLAPDLIIRIHVPKRQHIQRGDYLSLTHFVTSPSQKLERAYNRAQKAIIADMERNKENKDPANLKIRFQTSFQLANDVVTKQAKLINEQEEEEILEIECVNEFNGKLDTFNLEYHTMVYLLQEECGFRVRAFMLYEEDSLEDRDIYLFLNLSVENMLKVATKYRIKKEVDYTFIDFFLNDPTSSDQRPLKLNSKFKSDVKHAAQLKRVNRYFGVHDSQNDNLDIIEQEDLLGFQEQNFIAFNEQVQQLFEFLKYRKDEKVTNAEKNYLHSYNRRKINPGCEKYYSRLKKRRQFFELLKQILRKYDYVAHQQPMVFQEFSLPDKNSKGSSFFQKLQSVLLYKPQVTSPYGDLSLFLNMERIKLSYMVLKSTFKLNYLSKMGFDIIALSNDFEKFGDDNTPVKGGIDGQCLADRWPMYSLFSDIKVIRNYLGDQVGYQVATKNYIIAYLLAIIVPYTVLFILEKLFGASVWVITSQLQAFFFALSYSIYLFYWELAEQQYLDNFADAVKSKVFLNKFRGPYLRNALTDEVNQFQPVQGFSAYIINTICILMILALLVSVGAIFHGCRAILREIYDPLSDFIVDSISLPHVIAYFIFFLIVDVLQFLLTDRIISLMVYLQNPPSDEDQKSWRTSLTFFYLIGIELIAPFFFFIIQPFFGTSCWSNSCENQMVFYIYSRYIINLAIACTKLGYVLVFKYMKARVTHLLVKKKAGRNYQEKLSQMLLSALEEAKKKEHREDKMADLINMHSFAIYCTLLPISPIISLITIFIQYINMRLALLYELRRPINRSQTLIPFSRQASMIFFLGIFLNAWVNLFTLQFVEKYMQGTIETFCTPITEQGIFLLKFLTAFLYILFCMVLGWVGKSVAKGLSNNKLLNRKNNKFEQYIHSRGGLKQTLIRTYIPTPLKSIFRIHNPDTMPHEDLDKLIYTPGVADPNDLDNPLNSEANLTDRH